MIRELKYADIPPLYKVLLSLESSTRYSEDGSSHDGFHRFMREHLASHTGKGWVLEKDGEPVGVILADKAIAFHTMKKQAIMKLLIVREDVRGGGGFLLRKFIRWAKSDPNVFQIIASPSAQSTNQFRIDLLFERLFGEPDDLYHMEI